MRKRPALWWLLVLLPLLARVGVDAVQGVTRPGPWLLVALPAVLLLAVVGWSHASRAPLAVQWEKELSLVGPLAVATMPVGGALACLPSLALSAGGLMLSGGGAFFAASRSFALEREAHSLGPWLLQPRRRNTLVALKFAALTLLLAALAAQTALAVAAPPRLDGLWSANPSNNILAGLLLVMTGLAVTYVPYMGLPQAQAKTPGWLVAVGVASVPAAAWLHDALFVPALFCWGLVFVVATFRLARRVDPFSASEVEPRLASFSLGLRGPLGQLVQKELRLQRGAFTLGTAMVLAWSGYWGVHTVLPMIHPPAITPPAAILGLLWSLSVCAALLAGAAAFSEERTMETLIAQEALLSRRSLFAAKATMALATSAMVSALLPMVLLSIFPGWSEVAREFKEASVPNLGSLSLAWLGVMTACAAVGLLASVVQPDTRRAFVAAMGIAGACAALLFAAVVGGGLVLLSAGQPAAAPAACAEALRLSPAAHSLVQLLERALLFAPLALVVAATLVTARSLWRGRSGPWPWLTAALVLLLGSEAAMLGSQQLRQAQSRAELCGTLQR